MHQPVLSLFRLVPVAFAAAFVAGSTGCIINANDFLAEGEGEDCIVLEDTCPSLACEFGNVVVDGCAICECADEPIACSDVAPPADCINAVQADDCSWSCDPAQACFADSDCRDDEFCAFVGTDVPRDDDGDSDAAQRPEPAGVCLPRETACTTDDDCGRGAVCENGTCVDNSFDCFADSDCFLGERCIFDGNTDADTGADIARSGTCQRGPDAVCTVDDDCDTGFHCEGIATPDAPNGLIVPAQGVCIVDDELSCTADQNCRRGQHCEVNGATNAIVAAPGVCVDDVTPAGECEVDSDCNGGTCVVTCEPDPTCPECSVCFFVGTCVEEPCTTDDECGENQFCDFNNTAPRLAPPPPDCDRDDANCQIPVPPQAGVCRDNVVVEPGCTSNDECDPGQFCDFGIATDEAQRPAPCDDASAGCDPVAPIEGVCRDIVVICVDDNQCAAGEFCDFGATPANGLVIAGGTCQPLDTDPSCSSDLDCDVGDFCDFGGTAERRPCLDANEDGICDDVVINEGICRPIDGPTGCTTDRECDPDQVCLLDTCNCPAVCVDDGNDGCVPCDCAPAGICVDVVIDDICFTDDDCGPGRFCNLGATVDENGRRAIPAAGICEDLPVLPTPCVDDDQCREGQICVFTEATVDPDGANRPGRTGECKSAPTR